MQAKVKLRSTASWLIRRHRWLPATSTIACAGTLLVLVVEGASPLWVLGACLALIFASYGWGYAVRALRVIHYPSLLNLPRRQYGKVWDALAASPSLARTAACGHEDERSLCSSAEIPVKNLIELADMRPQDDVLEFGCGVARIGLELAPRCRTWTGADVSTNMLAHLDEMDRWRYVKDAFRVLRPGGRLCIDNVDIESEEGWGAFSRDAESWQEAERPPYFPTPSTAAELTTYALRAGFGQVQAHTRKPLVILTAVKPTSERSPSYTSQ